MRMRTPVRAVSIKLKLCVCVCVCVHCILPVTRIAPRAQASYPANGFAASSHCRRCIITTVLTAMCCTTMALTVLGSVATPCTWLAYGMPVVSKAAILWKLSRASCWIEGKHAAMPCILWDM